jgi:hypothetical protein
MNLDLIDLRGQFVDFPIDAPGQRATAAAQIHEGQSTKCPPDWRHGFALFIQWTRAI